MKRGSTRLLLAVATSALLAACSQSRMDSYTVKDSPSAADSRGGVYKVGKPYQIQGVWYYPAEDYSYDETGIASWYGPDFHGKYTANGEIFNQNDVTAAHRTLPMPSFVRVTNLENGRSVVVRINDRGPFSHSRIIDLSRRAAQLLGMEAKGTAKVRVEIMADESRQLALRMKGREEAAPVTAAPRETVMAETLPAPGSREAPKPILRAAAPETVAALPSPPSEQQLDQQKVRVEPVRPTRVYVQAGAFSRFDNANRLSAALAGMGHTSVTQVMTSSGTFFRVRIGPIANVNEADALLEQVIGSGHPDARLVVD